MRQCNLTGAFVPEIIQTVKANPEWVGLIAKRILSAHFPETIHDDVQNALGLSLDELGTGTSKEDARRRDHAFRERVLMAYQYRCSVCGHDLRLGRQTIGLEAAHMLAYQGVGIILPQSSEYLPKPEYLHWHQQQLFKQPARAI
jgi:putative restriction endonuclease